MDIHERCNLIRAMGFIGRHLGDDRIRDGWATDGVADDGIEDMPDENLLFLAENDDDFADFLDSFLYYMKEAYRNGGIHCDGIESDNW